MSQAQRILVIDDEESVRDAFADALENTAYEVETASSGEEGVAKARSASFDLVFLDLKMPGMDGVETLRALRALDGRVPVYVVTAFHAQFLERLELAEREGLPFELVHKPLGQEAIRQVTEAVLRGPIVLGLDGG